MIRAVFTERADASVTAVRWHAPELTVRRVREVLDRAFAAESAGRTAGHTKLLVSGDLVDPADGRARLGKPERGDVFAWARAVQIHDRTLFRALVVALEPWFAERGLPEGRVEAEIFFGRYRGTPGGVHREACSNLHLVLEGEKHMHFWTGDDWPPASTVVREDQDPESGAQEQYLPDLDPREHYDRAERLTAVPGEGFAWQAGTWHVGRSDSKPSLALNIAAYGRGPARRGAVLSSWAERFAGEVPGEWLEEYRRHVGSKGGAGDLLAVLSGIGMRAPEAPRGWNSPPRAVSPVVPVLWHRDHRTLWVAALGAAVEIPDLPEIRDWLGDGLPAGEAQLVPPSCRPIAGWLGAQGAVTVGGSA